MTIPTQLSHLVLCLLACIAPADDPVTLRFRVKVPSHTPRDAVVYLAGNHVALGRWKPDGLALTRGDDGAWEGEVKLEPGAKLEYKVTLGAWERVEKTETGADIPNRAWNVKENELVEINVASWADGEPIRRRSTRTGTFRFHEAFGSMFLAQPRRITVWLPTEYANKPDERYPVLYMCDGQNIFDEATSAFGVEWGVDETAARLIEEGRIRPLIVVAIDNTSDRIDEYTATSDASFKRGGKGRDYARFLIDEVKPFIDRTYHTRPDPASNAIGGSSLGGLLALQIARDYPDHFGLCASLSPALWWDEEQLLRAIETDLAGHRSARVWVDIGTREVAADSFSVDHVRRLSSALEKAGRVPERDFTARIIEGGEHNEKAWAARVGDVLEFLFPSPPSR